MLDEERKAKKREYMRKWRAAHKEEGREYHRQYFQDHKEEYRERNRKWRTANPEKAREISRKYQAEQKRLAVLGRQAEAAGMKLPPKRPPDARR